MKLKRSPLAAAVAAAPMDPDWLGPADEQGWKALLDFLFGPEGVVPRASADRAADPVPPERDAMATYNVQYVQSSRTLLVVAGRLISLILRSYLSTLHTPHQTTSS